MKESRLLEWGLIAVAAYFIYTELFAPNLSPLPSTSTPGGVPAPGPLAANLGTIANTVVSQAPAIAALPSVAPAVVQSAPAQTAPPVNTTVYHPPVEATYVAPAPAPPPAQTAAPPPTVAGQSPASVAPQIQPSQSSGNFDTTDSGGGLSA